MGFFKGTKDMKRTHIMVLTYIDDDFASCGIRERRSEIKSKAVAHYRDFRESRLVVGWVMYDSVLSSLDKSRREGTAWI